MLKKVLGASIVSLALVGSLHAEEKSGFFVGIHGGVVLSQTQAQATTGKVDKTEYTYNGGANIGYQYFFAPVFGARLYASYDFNGFLEESNSNQMHDFAGNVDLLFNIINGNSVSFGIFGGIGFGYSLITGDVSKLVTGASYSGFIMPVNVGVNLTFAQRHRIELAGKLPVIFYPTIKNDGASSSYRPWVVNVGYTFIF